MPRPKRMGHTGLFTGSRRRQDKKTEASKVRNGRAALGISVIGGTTARKASESSSIKMGTSMRACGCATGDMVRVPTGEMKMGN